MTCGTNQSLGKKKTLLTDEEMKNWRATENLMQNAEHFVNNHCHMHAQLSFNNKNRNNKCSLSFKNNKTFAVSLSIKY